MMNTQTTILTIALAVICATGYAANNNQAVTDTAQTEEVLTIAQEMPVFPGGDSAMYEYIVNNMAYPEEVREKKLAGKVFVQFVITKNGEVVNPRIARGIDPLLDNEIIRVVQNMPKWAPGKNNGESVNVVKTIPVSFKNEPQSKETIRDINFIVLINPETNAWDTVYTNVDEMPEYTSNEPEIGKDLIPILRDLNVDEMPEYISNEHEKGMDDIISILRELNVDVMPDFTSSEHKIRRDIATHVRYPKEAKKKKMEGSVLVQFVVDEKGKIGNISIINSTHPIFNEEAIRAVKTLPGKFKPGRNQGKPVKVRYTVPVNFAHNTPPTSNFTSNDINLADSSFILSYNFKTNAWDTVYSNIDEMPEYPGGEHNLQMDIVRNLRYPKDAVKKKLQGKVLVQFVIDEKGKVRNIRIIDSPHPIFNEEAIRAVELLRNFKPGKFQGKPIKVQYTLPINFQLD